MRMLLLKPKTTKRTAPIQAPRLYACNTSMDVGMCMRAPIISARLKATPSLGLACEQSAFLFLTSHRHVLAKNPSLTVARAPRRAFVVFSIAVHHIIACHHCKLGSLERRSQFRVAWIDELQGFQLRFVAYSEFWRRRRDVSSESCQVAMAYPRTSPSPNFHSLSHGSKP